LRHASQQHKIETGLSGFSKEELAVEEAERGRACIGSFSHEQRVTCVALSDDLEIFAAGGSCGSLRVWRIEEGEGGEASVADHVELAGEQEDESDILCLRCQSCADRFWWISAGDSLGRVHTWRVEVDGAGRLAVVHQWKEQTHEEGSCSH